MAKNRVGIKEAARITGLSEWELRTGSISGKYPSMRVGGPRGRIIFDIELLEKSIEQMMLDNIKPDNESEETYGTIRAVK